MNTCYGIPTQKGRSKIISVVLCRTPSLSIKYNNNNHYLKTHTIPFPSYNYTYTLLPHTLSHTHLNNHRISAMSAALECWSSRASTDEDMVEQVLMRTQHRSESLNDAVLASSISPGGFKETSAMQKRIQRLSRNVSEAIASLKNSLNLDSAAPSGRVENCRKNVWAGVVRNLTQLYPGSQLPEKLVSNIRKHYDSLPLR